MKFGIPAVMLCLLLVPGCASDRPAPSTAPAASRTPDVVVPSPMVPSPSGTFPGSDPALVANATRCTAPDEGMMDALAATIGRVSLQNPAVLVTSAVGTAAGQASRYSYLAAETETGPVVWAAVNPYQHGGWLAVNKGAKDLSPAGNSADSTDAALQRNLDDYTQAVSCTAEGGFPGGAPFSAPPDGKG